MSTNFDILLIKIPLLRGFFAKYFSKIISHKYFHHKKFRDDDMRQIFCKYAIQFLDSEPENVKFQNADHAKNKKS